MAYSKQTWVRGEKVASVKLNHMEDGIAAISANGAIGTSNLANASVTNAKLDQEAVDSDNIRNGAITTPTIYDGAVTMPKLGADVIAELDNKADIDGSYESMTVGNAEQLVSSVGITDETPYNFRTSGGSTEIGDREELNAVVGGSVPWNQLVVNGNFATADGWGSGTASNNVLSFVGTTAGAFNTTKSRAASVTANHVLFISVDVKCSSANEVRARYPFVGTAKSFSADTWFTYAIMGKPTSVSQNVGVQFNGITDATYYMRNFVMFDITLSLGATIADYIYALEQSNAGAGVAYFRKLFPNPYYAYNAGELLSVQTNLHRMVGFNQWDEVWEEGILNSSGAAADGSNAIRSKNYCRCIQSTVYYVRSSKTDGGSQNRYYVKIAWYDANKNFISGSWENNRTITSPDNAAYFKICTNTSTAVYGSTYLHDICINISWDGERDGEYEPYEAHEYALDDITLRGILKLDANNNLYADGDRYLPDGTVERRYGIVDLSNLDWSDSTSTRYISKPVSGMKPCPNSSETPNIVAEKYRTIQWRYGLSDNPDAITVSNDSNAKLYLYKDANTSTPSGYLVYELATPTTETADPYQQTQIVDDFGTEEFVDAAVEANERDVAIPVGNETFYPQNLRKKIEGLPFDFSTLIARTEKAFKATKAYAVNEFLIINNQLYKTRTSIANGATITVGTNVIATTICAELTAILNS